MSSGVSLEAKPNIIPDLRPDNQVIFLPESCFASGFVTMAISGCLSMDVSTAQVLASNPYSVLYINTFYCIGNSGISTVATGTICHYQNHTGGYGGLEATLPWGPALK